VSDANDEFDAEAYAAFVRHMEAVGPAFTPRTPWPDEAGERDQASE
jgi:hypothetical protein